MKNKLYLFVLFVFLSYSFFISSGASGNATRTAALTWSIVNLGALHIDAYQNVTVDKAFYGGHYYNAGEPGVSFLGVPVYFIYKSIGQFMNFPLGETGAPDLFSIYILRIFLISLPSALFCVVLHDYLKQLSVSERMRYRALLLYAFCSPAFVYATLFYRHQLSAVITFYVFTIFFAMKKNSYENRKLFLAGLLSSLNFFCDYASVIPHGILFLYFLAGKGAWKRAWVYFSGAVPFMVCFLGYNAVCFGNMFHTGDSYSLLTTKEAAGKNIFQFFLTFWKPDARAFYGVTLSPYRGLFYFLPLAILPFMGIKQLAGRRGYRQEVLLFFAIILIHVYFVSTIADWMGALGFISRHLVIILPFLISLTALTCSRYPIASLAFTFFSFCSALLVNISPYGEIPGEVRSPAFFVVKAVTSGFYRENLFNWLHVSGHTSTCAYIFVLLSGILFFANLKERKTVSERSP